MTTSNMDTEIDFYKKKLEECKVKLMHSILDAIVDEESFWKYYPMLHDVLPANGWRRDCPENLQVWFNQTEHKEAVRHFDDLLEGLEDYRESPEELEEYFKYDGKALRKVIEENSTWDLMQQIIEYTLQHRICGTTFDW